MSIKVSVIIPVYNCEKYIGECIESLINQTLKECEFIFVNDGSSDKSKKIIEEYAKGDSRIKLINQKNSGVSVARNTGLKNAVGEYIGFVDGDDYIDIDYYENLYNTAIKNSCDIVMCDWKSEGSGFENKLNIPFERNKVLNKRYIEDKIYPFFIESNSLNSVCNKIFSNYLIRDKNIMFPVGVELGEDGFFNIVATTYADKVYYLDSCGYYYREVEGSATRNVINSDYFNRTLIEYKTNYKEYEKWPIKMEEIQRLKSKKLINDVISLTYYYFIPNKSNTLIDRYSYIKKMINNEEVCKAIKKYYKEITQNKGRYEKKIIDNIKKRNTFGIYALTLYSRLRNGEWRIL